jgi:catechol-2,3-dioxygenase
MAFGEVLRPGHIQIRVRDLTSAVQHYVEILGLSETARDEAGGSISRLGTSSITTASFCAKP